MVSAAGGGSGEARRRLVSQMVLVCDVSLPALPAALYMGHVCDWNRVCRLGEMKFSVRQTRGRSILAAGRAAVGGASYF